MGEFCVKHGAGKKWYLQAENYSEDLLSGLRRRDFILEFFGQVLPLEDIEKIFGFVNSIVRVPCICRHVTLGREGGYCYGVSLGPGGGAMTELLRGLDSSFLSGPDTAGFEELQPEEALADYTKPLSPRAALVEALRLAVHNWSRDPVGHPGGNPGIYHYGEAALTIWADDLARADAFTEEQRGSLKFVSWWNFASLLDARRAAVAFLERQGALLGAESEECLRQAREVDVGEVALLEERGQEALREACAVEAEAVGYLEQALAAAR
jgi:hypothetical protein